MNISKHQASKATNHVKSYIICLLMKEHITAYKLAKPVSEQASGPSCQFAGNTEDRRNVKLCAISKIQTVGISTGQMPWVLQQIICKEKKQRGDL